MDWSTTSPSSPCPRVSSSVGLVQIHLGLQFHHLEVSSFPRVPSCCWWQLLVDVVSHIIIGVRLWTYVTWAQLGGFWFETSAATDLIGAMTDQREVWWDLFHVQVATLAVAWMETDHSFKCSGMSSSSYVPFNNFKCRLANLRWQLPNQIILVQSDGELAELKKTIKEKMKVIYERSRKEFTSLGWW